jgi:hypothetical protein
VKSKAFYSSFILIQSSMIVFDGNDRKTEIADLGFLFVYQSEMKNGLFLLGVICITNFVLCGCQSFQHGGF